MEHPFFAKPILNSPYAYPPVQWALDETGQATHDVHPTRHTATFITPIPRAKKHSGVERQVDLDLAHGVSDGDQRYHSAIINGVRAEVGVWRSLPNTGGGGVCPETAIGLTEAAPNRGKVGQEFLDHVQSASGQAKPGLLRLALQLATVAGKTTVMAMLKAWQTVNAARRATSKKHTRGFVLVAPGLAIKDRLQVLLANGAERDDKSREPIPSAMVGDLGRAKIVITKHHAFTLREPVDISKGTRLLLQGRGGSAIDTLETEGQMVQRVMPEPGGRSLGHVLFLVRLGLGGRHADSLRACVKNHNRGFELPYLLGAEVRHDWPGDAKDKRAAMKTRWLPGVNNLLRYGRCPLAAFNDVFAMQRDLADAAQAQFKVVLESAGQQGKA